MMRMIQPGNGSLIIDQDDDVLAKLEGQNFDDVDVSDMRIDADSVAKLYNNAQCHDAIEEVDGKTIEHAKRYAKMKQLYLDIFSTPAE